MPRNNKLLILVITLISVGLAGGVLTTWFFVRNQPTTNSFSSLGEQIYFTGRGENGKLISFSGGPHWMSMHGGSCASCHGKKGRGGKVDMTNEKAPAITWKALSRGEHEHENEKKNHEDKHEPYNEKTIKKAIIEGKNTAGDEFNSAMPRWKMNDKEAEAIVNYLKTLD